MTGRRETESEEIEITPEMKAAGADEFLDWWGGEGGMVEATTAAWSIFKAMASASPTLRKGRPTGRKSPKRRKKGAAG